MKVCLKCKHQFSSNGWICPGCKYEPLQLNGFIAHAEEFAHGGGGFKSEYFAELARLESTNFWFRARNELILWALRTFKPDAQSFLEVGCGTGFVLSGIAELHPDMALSGSEIFLEGLSHAATRVTSAKFMQMDARCVPFVDEFDAIGTFDMLEHVDEDAGVLAQLHRALRPEGVLLLTVPQHAWLWSRSDDYACHVRRYNRIEIEDKVQKAGFKLLRSTSFITTLLPAMVFSREVQKRKKSPFDPAAELKIAPWLNTVFEKVLYIDRTLIKLGLNLPFGGSRLVVARKNNK